MKEIGIEKLIVIAPHAGVRMMGSSISLAAGLSFRFVATPFEADELLAKFRAKKPAVAS